MAKLGIVASARIAGVSRSTIHRFVKSGKLTVTEDRRGNRVIDTAELTRVFGELRPAGTADAVSLRRRQQPHGTIGDTSQLEYLRREVARLESELERLRRELADERNERRSLQSIVNQRALTGPGLVDTIVGLFRR